MKYLIPLLLLFSACSKPVVEVIYCNSITKSEEGKRFCLELRDSIFTLHEGIYDKKTYGYYYQEGRNLILTEYSLDYQLNEVYKPQGFLMKFRNASDSTPLKKYSITINGLYYYTNDVGELQLPDYFRSMDTLLIEPFLYKKFFITNPEWDKGYYSFFVDFEVIQNPELLKFKAKRNHLIWNSREKLKRVKTQND